MDRKEFQRLRKVAQSRSRRLQAAGFKGAPTFKTLRELESERDIIKEAERITKWLRKPTSTVKGARLAEKERRERKREAARKYRERRKHVFESLTDKEKSLIKSAKTMGMNLTPDQVKRFAEYIKYRYSQTKELEYYFFDTWLKEFEQMEKHNYTLDQIVNDFEQYKNDAEQFEREAAAMTADGYSSAKIDEVFSQMIKEQTRKKNGKG